MITWQPISSAPIKPYDPDDFMGSDYILVWNGSHCEIAWYSYTNRGRGRWQGMRGIVYPTHWMPAPAAPGESS